MTKIHIFLLVCALHVITAGTVYSSEGDSRKATLKTEYANNQQQFRVTGSVADASTGEPLLGVTVVVKGTTIGQITDAMGNFSINIPQREVVLVFSSIGYASQEVAVTEGSSISVSMNVDVLEMEEVVVVGYGIQRKQSVVGAISQATGDEIMTNLRGADLTNALTGSLPGLVTVQVSGIPGGSGAENPATEIFIRGRKTWNNSQPLILVDGIEREMNDVDPYTVEQISILKDASATAVFGVKGANGVILITTKRGQVGRPRLTLNVTSTVKTPSRLQNILGSYDALKLRNYAVLNQVPAFEETWQHMVPDEILQFYKDQTYPDYLPDVNWQKETLKKYVMDQTVNLSVAGGTNFVKYFGSLSYVNEGDIMNIYDVGRGYNPNFNFSRLNFRSNLDFNLTPSTVFSTNLSGFTSTQQRPRFGFFGGAWFALYGYPPDIMPIRYSDGTWAEYPFDSRWSNQHISAMTNGVRVDKSTQVNTDFQLRQKLDFITTGLSVGGKLSYDIRANTQGPFIIDDNVLAKYIQSDIIYEIEPGMTQEEIKAIEEKYTIWILEGENHGFDFTVEPWTFGNETALDNIYRSLNYELSMNYDRTFGKHTLGGLFLMSRNERATGSIFPSYREDWVGRVVYNYDNRYLFEFNGAYNGSEKFARENRFGFFPSLAMGWIISNESFFSPVTPVINNMKVRFSNGKVGSDAGIDRWLYTGSWDVTNTRYQFGSPFRVPSVYPQRFEDVIPNPDITWETSEKTDLGLEMGFFQNLINISMDLFWEDRTDIFISGDQLIFPVFFGAPPVAGNLGRVKTSGWEVDADFTKTTPGGLRLQAGLSWAFAKDLVIHRADPELRSDYQKAAGYPINQPRYTLSADVMNSWNDVYVGVLGQTNAFVLPGNFRNIDFDSDGVITNTDAVPYGYPARAQYTYAPRVSADYKGFTLSLGFYGAYNLQGDESNVGPFQFDVSRVNPTHKEGAWSPELGITTNATYPALRYASEGRSGGPVFYSRAAFRLKTAVLAYTLKSEAISRMGIDNMRLLINGENLFLWSDMLMDADATPFQSNRMYPLQKRVTFGVNLNF